MLYNFQQKYITNRIILLIYGAPLNLFLLNTIQLFCEINQTAYFPSFQDMSVNKDPAHVGGRQCALRTLCSVL